MKVGDFEGWEGNVEEYGQIWGLCENVVMRGVGVMVRWCVVASVGCLAVVQSMEGEVVSAGG
jgi:hypothetical protein